MLKYIFIFIITIFITNNLFAVANTKQYLAIKSSKINMRYGPGTIYPIKWVYTARGMPMEVLDEFGGWVYLRDVDGNEGWVLQRMMSIKHLHAVVTENTVLLKSKSNNRIKAHLDRLVFVEVKKCLDDMCQVRIEKIVGWVKKDCLWGIPRKAVEH